MGFNEYHEAIKKLKKEQEERWYSIPSLQRTWASIRMPDPIELAFATVLGYEEAEVKITVILENNLAMLFKFLPLSIQKNWNPD